MASAAPLPFTDLAAQLQPLSGWQRYTALQAHLAGLGLSPAPWTLVLEHCDCPECGEGLGGDCHTPRGKRLEHPHLDRVRAFLHFCLPRLLAAAPAGKRGGPGAARGSTPASELAPREAAGKPPPGTGVLGRGGGVDRRGRFPAEPAAAAGFPAAEDVAQLCAQWTAGDPAGVVGVLRARPALLAHLVLQAPGAQSAEILAAVEAAEAQDLGEGRAALLFVLSQRGGVAHA